ncbi:MAG: hypothetical protein EHM81_08640, partial [Chloroflexi bacterium]
MLAVILFTALLFSPATPAFAASQADLLVYPYIGATTPNSVVIAWATGKLGTGGLRFSQDLSYSNIVEAARFTKDGKIWYSATATGLEAGATYYYRIFQGGYDITPWDSITFTTAPGTATGNFSFAVLGDSQTANLGAPPNPQAIDLANQIDQAGPDLVVRVGDMIFDGSVCDEADSAWNQYIRNYF